MYKRPLKTYLDPWMRLWMKNKDMAERETSRDCEKIFVKKTLERERHILTTFLTEVYVSLEEIEKLMLDEPIWERPENVLDRIEMEREYLTRIINRERKNILSLLTGIQWSLDHLKNCLGESGTTTHEIAVLNERARER
ncbi:hypothetical protein TNCT_639821 [Trichonephila clavata]|uniref:Uncharacterized protein n=1 Tax=Trichonephila clavata TaxID=2740835 RepID=A0A8X6J402_TRICU|nr:hypothetical protein TNCT_639821 [Trichonephila clavata]